MRLTGHTRVYGLIGRPVRHSLSPALHNAWFAHHGVDGVYVAFEAPADPGDIVAAIRTLGLAGANLTVPHKATVIADLDEIDAAAGAVWAVNTVVRDRDRLTGTNTDVIGFDRALDELGVDPHGARCAVLGVGGAGRAAAYALLRRGARVDLVNRTESRARAAAAKVTIAGGRPTVAALEPGAFASLAPELDLVVNATAGPARSLVAELPTGALPTHAAWIDLNYWDPEPPHLAELAERGHPVQTGHPMLLHQAAAAFVHFTGLEPDLDVGRRSLNVP